MEPIKIMPCLDMKEGRVVKGINFINLRDAGDPVENAGLYEQEGADELAMLDIAATVENRKTRLEWVKNVSAVINIPLTMGGGIATLEDIELVLEPGGQQAAAWAKECQERGAGFILPTSMDGDGTQAGYDLEFTKAIADAVSVPVIASGGAGKLEHFYEGVTKGGAQILLAASVFHYRIFSIREVKEYLRSRGLLVIL